MLDFTGVVVDMNRAADAGLLARIVSCHLVRTYRFLFAFVCVDLIYSLATVMIPMRTNAYAQWYKAGTAIELVLVIAVVMEVYGGALAEHPALAKFGSRTVGYVLVAAGVMAATAVGMDNTVPAGQSVILHRFFRIERTVDFGVVTFLAVISVFLVWFPVLVKRNIAYYGFGFAAFYASRSAGLLMINVLPPAWQRPVDNSMLLVSFACLSMLALFLRKESGVAGVIRRKSDPVAVAHVAQQLESINTALSRMGKR